MRTQRLHRVWSWSGPVQQVALLARLWSAPLDLQFGRSADWMEVLKFCWRFWFWFLLKSVFSSETAVSVLWIFLK